MRYVELIGAPGVGKTTLIETLRRNDSETFLFDLKAPGGGLMRALTRNRVAKSIKRSRVERKHRELLTHIRACYEDPTISDKERAERRARWTENAVRKAVAVRDHVDKAGRIFVFDEHLAQRGLSLYYTLAHRNDVDEMVYRYFHLIPEPDCVLFLEGSCDEVKRRNEARGSVNPKDDRGMDLHASLPAMEIAKRVMRERSVVFEVIDAERAHDSAEQAKRYLERFASGSVP